jgi:hypothetical protein
MPSQDLLGDRHCMPRLPWERMRAGPELRSARFPSPLPPRHLLRSLVRCEVVAHEIPSSASFFTGSCVKGPGGELASRRHHLPWLVPAPLPPLSMDLGLTRPIRCVVLFRTGTAYSVMPGPLLKVMALLGPARAAWRAVPSVVLVGRALAGLGAPFEHLYRGGIDLQICVVADWLQ